MKSAVFLFFLLVALSAWADNVTSKRVVDAGSSKAVVFEETVSPDGHYAVGWTILPRNKSKPVDWSLWDPEEPSKLIDSYVDPDAYQDKGDYELINCLIDLKGKKLLELPTDDPDYPRKNRGYIVTYWKPTGQGTRYALVESDARYSTENLWLIRIDSAGMHQTDLAKEMQKAVDPVVEEKRPIANHGYETTFSLSPDDATHTVPVVFNDSTVTIPFSSDIPKFGDENSEVDGTVIIKLPEGTVQKASSPTPRDDPFKDMPELAKADHELNLIYSQLSQKLSPKQRAELKQDQLVWIAQRDTDANTALSNSRDDRNKSLLKSTQDRLKDLQDRLNTLH